MVSFITSAATLVLFNAVSSASAMPMGSLRSLHRGKGGGGRGGRAFFQGMLEAQCEVIDCDTIDKDSIDCNIARPERPDFSTMTAEEKVEAWGNMKVAREEHFEQIADCGCCTEATFDEILDGMKEDSPRGDGGHGGRWNGGKHGGMHGKGHGFRQEMLQDTCEVFDCETIDKDTIDCNIARPERPDFSTMTAEEKQEAWTNMKMAREEHFEQIAGCGCCTEATFDEIFSAMKQDSTSGDGFMGKFGGGWKGKFMHGMSSSEDEGASSSEGAVTELQGTDTSDLALAKASAFNDESGGKIEVENSAVTTLGSLTLAFAMAGIVLVIV